MDLLLLLSTTVCIAWFVSIRKSDLKLDGIEKWINFTAPVGKEFRFLYSKKQKWGNKEYLAKKLIRLTDTEIEVENFDGSTFKLPRIGLKQWSHPYNNLARLEINPACLTIEVGQAKEFSVQAISKDGSSQTMLADQVAWSETGGRINKSQSFQTVYRPTKAGVFTVIASLGTFSVSTKVTVRDPAKLTRLTISPLSIALERGDTLLLTAAGKDQYDQSFIANEIQWLVKHTKRQGNTVSNPQLVEVNDQALHFKAEALGEFIIIAKAGSVEGKATVTVKEPARLANLKISPSMVNLVTGQKQRFTAYGTDQYDCRINVETIEWLASGGSISVDGDFWSEMAGQSTITARVGDVEAKAYAVVTEPSRLSSLVIEPLSAEMQLGQTQGFTVTGRDQHGRSMHINALQWQTASGHIDNNGVFKATTLGDCTVTVRSGGISSQVRVTVIPNISSFPANLILLKLRDPVTQGFFQPEEIAYCCTICQLGHHEASWEYFGRKCSGCESDQNVDVYRLPHTFLAKATQYSPPPEIDLSPLPGRGADGRFYPLIHTLTPYSNSSNSSEESFLRFEYLKTQIWGSIELLARRILSVHKTAIEVEDCTGKIVWLPIALLVAVVVVPAAARGAFISGLVIWALNIQADGEPATKRSSNLPHRNVDKVFPIPKDGSDDELEEADPDAEPDLVVFPDPEDESDDEWLNIQPEGSQNYLVKPSNRYILVRAVAQRSRQLRNQNEQLTNQQLLTRAIEEILGDTW